jgi:anti-sigma regulatory factor (Ser/Thr protein kinase)
MTAESGHDDDAAVLAVRRTGAGEESRCRLMILAGHDDARIVADARAQVHGAVCAWDLEAVAEVCVLLTSELVTNAVRHGGAGVEVRYGVVGGALRVEVYDDGAGLPQVRRADSDDEGGRGLMLLEGLSERWGVRRARGGGKSVWFEVAARHG